VPPAKERDEQPGNGGVLADDGLGDLGADREQRRSGALGLRAFGLLATRAGRGVQGG
jgi:hypothetical protein